MIIQRLKGYLKMFQSNKTEYSEEFFEIEKLNAIKRIKMLNIFMIIFSIYLFYNDLIMKTRMDNKAYTNQLFRIHLLILIVAIVYLGLMFLIKKRSTFIFTITVSSYLALCIYIGILISLNSIYYSLGITNFIVISIFLAIFIPFKPLYMIVIYLLMDGVFIIGLRNLEVDRSIALIHQINGTVMIVISLFLSVIIYFLRKSDYISKKELVKSNATLEAIFEVSPFSMSIVIAKTDVILKMNKRAKHEYLKSDQIPSGLKSKSLFKNESDYNELTMQLKEQGSVHGFCVEMIQGDHINWAICDCEIIEYEGETSVLVASVDISQLKNIEDDLRNKASIDRLTGVVNRNTGEELLEKLYANKEIFSVIFCDINSLKKINDEYGHDEGDAVIKLIASGIKDGIMEDDILFRYGGDEFVIIIKSDSELEIQKRMTGIVHILESISKEKKKPYVISVSYGYDIIDYNSIEGISELLKKADENMYINKKKYYKNMNS